MVRLKSRLPWLSILIPLGYLPDYFFGSSPGWTGSILIVMATALAWFSVSRLSEIRLPNDFQPRARASRKINNPETPGYLPAFNPHDPGPPPSGPRRAPAAVIDEAPPTFVQPGATRRSVPRWIQAWIWPLGLTVGAYLFASIIAAGSMGRVAALGRVEAFSVGIFQQAMWWTAHGVPMGSTYATGDASLHRLFGIHFSPLLAALSPLYRLHPDASTLLWVQALVLGFAALPLYAAARLRIGRTGAGLVALAWWLHPTIVGSPLSGFHELSFAPLFAFAAFWALLRRRWAPCMLALVALLLIREDLAVFVILMGFVAAAQKAESRFVIGPIVVGGGWIAACLLWILPHYRTSALVAGSDPLLREYFAAWTPMAGNVLAQLTSQPMQVVNRVFSFQGFAYVASLLRPAGFLLPLPDPAWIAGLGKLALNLGSEETWLRQPFAAAGIPLATAFFMALPGALAAWGRRFGRPVETGSQYSGTIEERGAAVRAAARVGDLWNERQSPAAGAWHTGRAGAPAATIAVIAGVLSLMLGRIDRQFTPAPRADLADQMAVLSAVPDSVSVLAPEYAYARLANRSRFASLESVDRSVLTPEVFNRFDAIVLDMAPDSHDMRNHPDVINQLEAQIRTNSDFRETLSAGGLHLFERLKAFP